MLLGEKFKFERVFLLYPDFVYSLSNRALFRVYIASSKGGGLGEFETVMHNFREFSRPSKCLDEAI